MTPARWLADLRAALMLLTILPVWPDSRPPPNAARTLWAYPLVGAGIGALGAGAYWLVAGLGAGPAGVAAVAALMVLALVTGGLHEDGLADMADGLGGRTRERKLEIMRDSRIGTYGALALMGSLGLRGTALAALAEPPVVAAALIAAGALSRGAALLLPAWLPPARSDGLGRLAAGPRRLSVGAGLLWAGLAALAVLPAGTVLLLMVVAATAALGVGSLAKRQIGGYTGDILGAAQQAGEIAVLLALVLVA